VSLSTIPKDLAQLTDDELLSLTNDALHFAKQDRQEWQLSYYKPASARALKIHLSTAHLIGIGGGNRSGKTDTNLAEAAIQATGIIPESLRGVYPREKLRGPITIRVVCESHTTTLAPVILHKLNYTNWNGLDTQGGERGHWGWIPKACLVQESWEKSWKESKRQLTTLCRDPDHPDRVLGYSVWQFMSHDQDPAKFASGEFHLVVIDEPPKYSIYRENRARIMSVGGRMLLGMTWPDDPTIPVDWIFDEIYDIGQAGPKKHPDVEWIELNTLENPNIDQASVAREASAMTETERACRIGGKPIRFSNLIHPIFTDTDSWWCFGHCNAEVLVQDGACVTCQSKDVEWYNHVGPIPVVRSLPTVFLLDPHPRKPHMFCYVQVDPHDDYQVVYADGVNGEPVDVARETKQLEQRMGLLVAKRLMDPHMGKQPRKRDMTWQEEFASEDLYCELASDSEVGRARVNEYLKPDPHTKRPRLRFDEEHCAPAIYQIKRFSWDDFKHMDNRDQKQEPRKKYDDYPALLRYLLNDLPLHSVLRYGGYVVKPAGRSVNGY
jgi:hypothetical protein